MSNQDLIIDLEPPIGWFTINRPQAHNALNSALWKGIAAGLDEVAERPDIRVVVLRGAGERAFISGADISEFNEIRNDAEAARRYDELSEKTWSRIETLGKPVIAMVNGLCYGGGVSIAACCDLRIAAEHARFAIPALKLGLAYPLAAIERLVRVAGSATASEMLLTGQPFSAEQARQAGLVHRVVAADQLEEAVRTTAGHIAAGAPFTLAAHKLAIREVAESGRARAVDQLEEANRRCFASEDYREGVRAFLEKRAPQFNGR